MVLRELHLRHGLEDFFDVGLHELHHEEYVSDIAEILWCHNIENSGGELVALHLGELSQYLNLSNDFLTVILAFENVIDELNGNNSSIFSMFCLYYFTVASNPDELNELIVFVSVSPYR